MFSDTLRGTLCEKLEVTSGESRAKCAAYLAEDPVVSTRRAELLSKQAQLKAFREEMDDLSQ